MTFAGDNSADWRALAPAARITRSIAGAITGLILSTPVAIIATLPLRPLGVAARLIAIVCVVVAGAAIGVWIGRLRWKRTRWKLDEIGLHVRRGLIWRTEVLIPRSRVQHLDIERGPIERQFAVATLVVHTAGTQTHALRQSGLDAQDAVALRDALIPDASRHVDAL